MATAIRTTEEIEAPVLRVETAPVTKRATERLVSLDAFRGMTILLMLLVNNIALNDATPKTLAHAEWSGRVHAADLVFPWFLLIVGVAIPWAAASHRRRGLSTGRSVAKAFVRAAGLVALGCVVDSVVGRQFVIGLGVLQVIGLAYLVAALCGNLPVGARFGLAAALLVGHAALIRFYPIPGVGAGRFSEDVNVITWINETFLRAWHLNGLISVVPTAALALIGTGCGDILRRETLAPWRRFGLLLGLGLALTAVGWFWGRALPMNKPLWTGSYIVFTAGTGACLLSVLYLVIDIAKWRAWAILFVVPGMNAIVAYVLPILIKVAVLQTQRWPNSDDRTIEQTLQKMSYDAFGRIPGGWAYTLGYIAVWWIVLFALYRRRIFVRL